MRFACNTTAAPGAQLMEQCDAIARGGCTGIETLVFPTTHLEAWQREVKAATANAGLHLVDVILGGLALHRGGPMPYVREAMHAIAELGAAVLLTPEYHSQDPLPLSPPFPAAPVEDWVHVYAALDEISELATALRTRVWLEPITQFESRFCRSVSDALTLGQHANNPLVQIALDTHNMNITEASITQSIRDAGSHIGHVHLADNTRRLPGRGHIAFAEVMATLREVDYDGWFGFECSVAGDFVAGVKQCITWLEGIAGQSDI